MPNIRFHARPGNMGSALTDVPAFPGDTFSVAIPEAIGDFAQTYWPNRIAVTWQELDNGVWRSEGKVEGELSYVATITPHEDTVDVRIALTNHSPRAWRQSLAFNCFNCGGSIAIRDHECVRHYVRMDGKFKRLIEIPRKFGPRPTVQLYSVQGALLGREIPFVANFQATPEDVVLEGWMAIQSRDGKRLVAAVSKPALFLFQNMEYSCIHSAPSFGALKPGETGEALTKLYFVESPLEKWYQRMQADLRL